MTFHTVQCFIGYTVSTGARQETLDGGRGGQMSGVRSGGATQGARSALARVRETMEATIIVVKWNVAGGRR